MGSPRWGRSQRSDMGSESADCDGDRVGGFDLCRWRLRDMSAHSVPRSPTPVTLFLTLISTANQVQLFGHGLGDFSSPEAALLSACLLGGLMGAVPVGGAEVLILLIAGLEPRTLVVPLVLVMTAGHVLGKLLWYWAGTQHHRVRQPWVRRQVDAAERFLRSRPRIGLGALTASALVSIPPFHLTAIAAGVIRSPLIVFVLVAFAGRAVRFGVIAMVPHLVRFLLP